MLVSNNGGSIEEIIPILTTFASGLHGTHSFENLVGISTYIQMKKEGIRLGRFWANGDDQNFMVHKNDIDKFFDFVNQYFKVSKEKSLSGSRLGVWSRMWFSDILEPTPEIGTFRSIWEREGGDVDNVEPSKFQSNYCKIVQVIMLLDKLGFSDDVLNSWAYRLSNESKPRIMVDRVPKFLENLSYEKGGKTRSGSKHLGLDSVKQSLLRKTWNLKILDVSNYYQLLSSMFNDRRIYTLNVKDVLYHKKGYNVMINSSLDYSDEFKDVPWIMRKFNIPTNMTDDQKLVRSILQGTKSYDGPVSYTFQFNSLVSLAKTLNRRNKIAWNKL